MTESDDQSKVQKSAAQLAAEARHEAAVDRLAKKFAKKMGRVHVSGGGNDALLKVANEVFRKSALRKVN